MRRFGNETAETARGKLIMITFTEKDHIWQNETTNYWFDVDDEQWCISDCNCRLTLLGCGGCPVEQCNDRDNLLEQLTPHYLNHIEG